MENFENIKKNIIKTVAGVALGALTVVSSGEAVIAQNSYQSLAKKYDLELKKNELVAKLEIPKQHQEFLRKFLLVLEKYTPNMSENDLEIFLNEANSHLAHFSDFRLIVSKPMSAKDPIKDNLLMFTKKHMAYNEGKPTEKFEIEDRYFFIKDDGKWAVYGSYFNFKDYYRNVGDFEGVFLNQSTVGVTRREDGGYSDFDDTEIIKDIESWFHKL